MWDSGALRFAKSSMKPIKQRAEATPSDLHAQKERIQEFCSTIGLAQLSRTSTEADDLMDQLRGKHSRKGLRRFLSPQIQICSSV